MTRILATLAMLLLGLSALPAEAQKAKAKPQPTGRFLHLSDIHFDPMANARLVPALVAAPVDQWELILVRSAKAPPAQMNEDANYALMRSALTAAAAQRYDYVLYTGDYLAHDFHDRFKLAGGQEKDYDAFVIKTLQFMNREMAKAFAPAPLITSFGNNDTDCEGNYQIDLNDPMLAAVGGALPEIRRDPQAMKDFATGGYYRIVHPTIPGRDFIVMDDLYLSAKYKAECGNKTPNPGATLLAWLEATLKAERASGRTATLVLHIPPGIDPFLAAGKPNGSSLFLTVEANTKLLALLTAYADVVRDIYAGHTHTDEFRIVPDASGKPLLPIRIGPSISPNYLNAPAYSVFDYVPATGAVRDYATYTLGPVGWTLEYRFGEAYGFDGWTADALAKINGAMGYWFVRKQYGNYMMGDPRNNLMAGGNWKLFACAQVALTDETFNACTAAAPAGN
ncbi:metallophosphoesterase [Sphingomonas sp.]|uniref:metallophosphoesterase n=1 Tax=Sphingomonas sp. TaxID=28214 RepID=UPI001B1FFEAD|nr:metallophosphoesterase [Sphingomonas sp.]MBO9711567.1 metallophosphoesterase [Sphingomonas sp.]